MSRTWKLAVPAALLVAAACADAPTAPEAPDAPGLELLFPAFQRAQLVMEERGEISGSPRVGGPAAISEEEPPPPAGEPDPNAVAAIFNPNTFVYFNPDHVYAQGEHRYQGSKSRIETLLRVSYQGEPVGSQLGVREDSKLPWISWLTSNYIQAVSRIFTEHQCGLSASASSDHRAWWEVVMGSPVSTFSNVETSTFAPLRHQVECAPPDPGQGPGGGGSSSGYVCRVSIWYDLSTGEVLDVDVLWCEEIGG